MTRFCRVPLVAWAVFLAVFLPGFGGLGENVLCFGADGHVAFETASFSGTCSSAPGRMTTPFEDSDRGLAVSLSQDHCGPCVDFPVLNNELGRGISRLVFQKANHVPIDLGGPATLSGSSIPGTWTVLRHAGIHLDLPDPTSNSLRNTVLLI